MKRILITGAVGFIGYHLAIELKKRGDFVCGLDNFNPYYDQNLKWARAKELKEEQIEIFQADIQDADFLSHLLEEKKITHVVHLAAQAGVRYSLTNPKLYVTSNLDGFVSVLECVKNFQNIKFVYASSSSVYGNNKKIPFSVNDNTDAPSNLYGATKKANEVIATSYHHLYDLSVTGLRYFTVYGPWGRPDMAYYRFTKNILEKKPIQVFNFGKMKRDFTYIDDIIRGTISAIDLEAECEIFNLGNNQPIELLELIEIIEECVGMKAEKEFLPLQPGEVIETYADIKESQERLNFIPTTSLKKGIQHFVEWYKNFYRFSFSENSFNAAGRASIRSDAISE